jgi:hypothetical protein
MDTNTPATPLPEHSPVNTVVGNLTRLDPDSTDDPPATINGGNPVFSQFTYTLVDSAGGRFKLAGPNNDQIQVNDPNALEESAPPALDDGMGHHYYNIIVRVTDGGGLTHDETIRVYVSPVAETVIAATRIGDDTGSRHQRSRIEQLQVTFSRPIDLGNPNTNVAAAFTLTRLEDNSNVVLNVTWGPTFTIATITFASGQMDEFGRSLIDGNYQLTVNGSQLRDNRGVMVDADNNGSAGGTSNVRFYRLFGDFVTSGNYHESNPPVSWRIVDNADAAAFRFAYGTLMGNPNYDSAFDIDGDGDVDNFDAAQFRLRYLTSLPEFP